MTDELLPPDPSRDGWYWVKQDRVRPDAWEWSSRDQKWAVGPWVITPEEAARHAILASPHPILMPEQLDALHALPDALRDRANKAVVSHSERHSVGDELFGRAGGIVSTFRECAAVIQEAIAAKPAPADPPGNGLDDVRAAAMEGGE